MATRKEIRVDIGKCTGCHHCETACSLKHSEDGVVNPKLSRIAYSEVQFPDAPPSLLSSRTSSMHIRRSIAFTMS